MGRIIPNVATVFLHHKDDMDSGRPDDRIEFIEDIGGGQGKVTANIDAPYAYACVTAFKDCDPADSVVVPRDDWDAIKKALKLFRLKDEGHNECFERVAEMYYKDTGKIAPGKDVPAAAPEYSSTFEEFCVWHKGIVLAALAAIEKGGQDE